MTMMWVGIGTAVVGAGSALIGSKRQADTAREAQGISQGQFAITNAQQQPFMQSGYGALSRMNTLLGLSPNRALPQSQPGQPNPNTPPPGMMLNGPNGPVRTPNYYTDIPPTQPGAQPRMANPRLHQLLQLRADHGDKQAEQMLGLI
jgi:hypothetical protein